MPFAKPKPGCDERPEAKKAAGIVFVSQDGQVLLLRRAADEANYGGHWGLPGGGGEEGETAQDTAIREFKEECGVDIDMGSTLKLLDRVDTPTGMQFSTFAKGVDEMFTPVLDKEHTGYCWASLDMLPRPLHPQVERVLGAHIGAAADMTPEDWSELRTSFAKWTREEEGETEHSEDGQVELPSEMHQPGAAFVKQEEGRFARDAAMAFDRNLYDAKGKRILGHDIMALDRAASSRVYDADGHLHVTRTPISKANVCEYWGHEIPGADELGLVPTRKYRLLRHPDELAKAAASSNGKQLLLGHVPVSADDPQKDKWVGSTGTDAEFDGTYLYNSLHLHDREGIQSIEDADKAQDAEADAPKGAKELSSAYRYRADMTPGVFKGEPYDGVMRDIDFNHVALVPEGRAGADVVVGDSQLKDLKEISMKKVLTRFAGASAFALSLSLKPKLAADAKIDLSDAFDGVTKKNFAEKRAGIETAVKGLVAGKLAKDAKIDDVLKLALDEAEKFEIKEGADEDPSSGLPLSKEDMEKKAKDESDDDEDKDDDKKKAEDEEKEEAEKNAKGEEDKAKDKKGLDKKAMDEALKVHGDNIKREMREVAQAYADVEPYVGKLALGMDSAATVYRTALKGLGMDAKLVDGLHPDALKPILDAQKKPGEKSPRIAQDQAAGNAAGFAGRWGDQTAHIN